jgi:hypothetical protein
MFFISCIQFAVLGQAAKPKKSKPDGGLRSLFPMGMALLSTECRFNMAFAKSSSGSSVNVNARSHPTQDD